MSERSARWAVVLGAGDGTRLRSLTTRRGVALPKQFCSFNGGPSLLQLAVRRAARVVRRERVLAVVARAHRAWWERDLGALLPENVVVQPANRGTAAGVLLPLQALRQRDPEGRIAILPSDHYVRHETILAALLDRAFRAVEREPDAVVLLGVEPDSPDSGYGWILPGSPKESGIRFVREFVEKPGEEVARDLMRRGGVWNSFLLVASVRSLWRLYERHLPELARRFDGLGRRSLDALYAELPVHDFSRELLEAATDDLRLLSVPRCGWSDLGTPARVAECAGRVALPTRRIPRSRPALRIDLARAI